MDVQRLIFGLEYDLKVLKEMDYEDTSYIEEAIAYFKKKPIRKASNLRSCPFCFKKDCDTTCGNSEKL